MSKIVEEWRVNEYEALKRADRRNTAIFVASCGVGAVILGVGIGWAIWRGAPALAHAIVAVLS